MNTSFGFTVANATIKRRFSKPKLVKMDLCNPMDPEYLNNAMVCAVEKETFGIYEVKNDDAMELFQA
ncbi:hypothetical protein Hdeb2414_s0012g00383761 [Helianthus debilis subsp. tardiflorus]